MIKPGHIQVITLEKVSLYQDLMDNQKTMVLFLTLCLMGRRRSLTCWFWMASHSKRSTVPICQSMCPSHFMETGFLSFIDITNIYLEEVFISYANILYCILLYIHSFRVHKKFMLA